MTNMRTSSKFSQNDSVGSLLSQAPSMNSPQYNQRSSYQYNTRSYSNPPLENNAKTVYPQTKYGNNQEQGGYFKRKDHDNISPYTLGPSFSKGSNAKGTSGHGTRGGKKEPTYFMEHLSALATTMLKTPQFNFEDYKNSKNNSNNATGASGAIWRDPAQTKTDKNKQLEEYRKGLAMQVQERKDQKQRELIAKREEELRDEERFQKDMAELGTESPGHGRRMYNDKNNNSPGNSPERGNDFNIPYNDENESLRSPKYERRVPLGRSPFLRQKFDPMPEVIMNMEIDQLKNEILHSQKVFENHMKGFKNELEKSKRDRINIEKNLLSLSKKGGVVNMMGDSVDILDSFIYSRGLQKELESMQLNNLRRRPNNQPRPKKNLTETDLPFMRFNHSESPVSKHKEFGSKGSTLNAKAQLFALTHHDSRAFKSQSTLATRHPFGRQPSLMEDNNTFTSFQGDNFEEYSPTFKKHRSILKTPKIGGAPEEDEDQVPGYLRNSSNSPMEKDHRGFYTSSEIAMRELETKLDNSRKPLFDSGYRDASPGVYQSRMTGLGKVTLYDLEEDKFIDGQTSVFLNSEDAIAEENNKVDSLPSMNFGVVDEVGKTNYAKKKIEITKVPVKPVKEEKKIEKTLVDKGKPIESDDVGRSPYVIRKIEVPVVPVKPMKEEKKSQEILADKVELVKLEEPSRNPYYARRKIEAAQVPVKEEKKFEGTLVDKVEPAEQAKKREIKRKDGMPLVPKAETTEKVEKDEKPEKGKIVKRQILPIEDKHLKGINTTKGKKW